MESRLQQAFYARTFSPDENKRRRRAAIPRPAGKAEDPDGQAKTHSAPSAYASAPTPRRRIPSVAIGRPGRITSCRLADYDAKPPLGPALNLPIIYHEKAGISPKNRFPPGPRGRSAARRCWPRRGRPFRPASSAPASPTRSARPGNRYQYIMMVMKRIATMALMNDTNRQTFHARRLVIAAERKAIMAIAHVAKDDQSAYSRVWITRVKACAVVDRVTD